MRTCERRYNARLCTVRELEGDAGKSTGCEDKGFDHELAWTSDACTIGGVGGVGGEAGTWAVRGSRTGAGPAILSVCYGEKGVGLANVICCGDAACITTTLTLTTTTATTITQTSTTTTITTTTTTTTGIRKRLLSRCAKAARVSVCVAAPNYWQRRDFHGRSWID